MTRSFAIALRAGMLAVSVMLFVGISELALRILYRDAGSSTLGGPGGRQFDHLTVDAAGLIRGRLDLGTKSPKKPRLMVIGDSITYGLGVRDWRDTWPEILARQLELHGRPHELAVFAAPGREIPDHVAVMRQWGRRATPDVLVYQWYVNDIEVRWTRPSSTRRWQQWPWHTVLRQSSYLYFILDHRLAQMLPSSQRSYVDAIRADFAPGTIHWAEFERQFHAFAVLAMRAAPRRIMMLYPQVPYRGRYPLQTIHDQMHQLAGPHRLEILPITWIRAVGSLAADSAAPWKQGLPVPSGFAGTVLDTPEYLFLAGDATVTVAVRPLEPTAGDVPIGAIQVIDAGTAEVIDEREMIIMNGRAGWQEMTIRLRIDGNEPRLVRIRLRAHGRKGWSVGGLTLPVDYGFDVVDLSVPLNAIHTHASAFDAHPNEAAHQVVADEIYRVLVTPN